MLSCAAPSAARLAAMTVENIGDVTSFLALKEEWRDLLGSSDADSFFLSWEWLYTWWMHLAEDRELAIVTLRADGELVAVAPLCLRPRSLPKARAFPVVEFLGSGVIGSDYLDVIIRRGWETQAQAALAAHFRRKRPVLRWTNVSQRESGAAAMAAVLAGEGWRGTMLSPTFVRTFRWKGSHGRITWLRLGPNTATISIANGGA